MSRAAERLGVSQPAMSRTLARLRDQLGDPLLVRGRGGMVLTPRAEQLATPLRRWLDRGEAMLRPPEFDPASLERTFRVASTDYGILSVLRPATARISAVASGVSMEVEAISSNSLRRLAEGRLDLVVIGYPPEEVGVRFTRLFGETRLGLMRRSHPAGKAPMTEDAFFEWPHVSALVGNGLVDPLDQDAEAMRRRRVVMSAPSFASIPFMVADTDNLAVLPARAARHFAEIYDLTLFEPPVSLPSFDYFAAWHERSIEDPATVWFAEQIEASLQPLDAPVSRALSGSFS